MYPSVIITAYFLCVVCSWEDRKDLIIKDYIVVPSTAPESFVQISTDFSRIKYIDRPKVQYVVNKIRVKHVRWSIHLYWFTDQSRGTFSLTKITRSERETHSYTDTTPSGSIIEDLDIHSTLDLVYLATGRGGLVEYNTTSKKFRQLKEGSFVALQLDSKNNLLYYMDCSKAAQPVLVKLDVASKIESGSYNLDRCYKMFEIDFTTEDIYLAEDKILFRTTLSSLTTTASWKKVKTFDAKISSIALGSKNLYLVLNAGNTIYYVSRVDDKTKNKEKFNYLYSVAVYEGPELEPEPETTAKSEVCSTTISIGEMATPTTTPTMVTTTTTPAITAASTATTAAASTATTAAASTATTAAASTATTAAATDKYLVSTEVQTEVPSGTERLNAPLKMSLIFVLISSYCYRIQSNQ